LKKLNKYFPDLTLIIPAKREADSLPIFLEELKFINCKKMIVLEKSDILTINSIKRFKVNLLFQKKNGYGNALKEGIKKTKTKYLCIINADGSMNPNSVVKMLMRTKIKNYDLIFASRYQGNGGSEDDNIVTFIGNKFFTWFGNYFFSLNITDILYTFILGRTNSFQNLDLQCSDFRICPEIPIKAKMKNFRYLCCDDYERKRVKGEKKVRPLFDGFLILKYLIIEFLNKKTYNFK
jgi:glycosyltransferase involved in cell wall biosynthesis